MIDVAVSLSITALVVFLWLSVVAYAFRNP